MRRGRSVATPAHRWRWSDFCASFTPLCGPMVRWVRPRVLGIQATTARREQYAEEPSQRLGKHLRPAYAPTGAAAPSRAGGEAIKMSETNEKDRGGGTASTPPSR